jgi:hypothetical protein
MCLGPLHRHAAVAAESRVLRCRSASRRARPGSCPGPTARANPVRAPADLRSVGGEWASADFRSRHSARAARVSVGSCSSYALKSNKRSKTQRLTALDKSATTRCRTTRGEARPTRIWQSAHDAEGFADARRDARPSNTSPLSARFFCRQWRGRRHIHSSGYRSGQRSNGARARGGVCRWRTAPARARDF